MRVALAGLLAVVALGCRPLHPQSPQSYCPPDVVDPYVIPQTSYPQPRIPKAGIDEGKGKQFELEGLRRGGPADGMLPPTTPGPSPSSSDTWIQVRVPGRAASTAGLNMNPEASSAAGVDPRTMSQGLPDVFLVPKTVYVPYRVQGSGIAGNGDTGLPTVQRAVPSGSGAVGSPSDQLVVDALNRTAAQLQSLDQRLRDLESRLAALPGETIPPTSLRPTPSGVTAPTSALSPLLPSPGYAPGGR
jgi:hypothetical protein